jgi:hypothetical protein
MFVVPPGLEGTAVADGITGVNPRGDAPVWFWHPATEAMPRLPTAARGQSNGRVGPSPTRRHLETDTETT